MLAKDRSSDLPPVYDLLSYACSTVWLIAACPLQKADVYLCSDVRTTWITWDFFSLCLKTSLPLVLIEDSVWKSMQQSAILQLILAFSPAYKGEWDLQSSGCVAFLWRTLYTGFKLFCLGYWEIEFIWQPQEPGPHLIACNENHPPVAGRNPAVCLRGVRAESFCWCLCKLFISFYGTTPSVWANLLWSLFSKVLLVWNYLKLRVKLLFESSESLHD